MYTCIHVYIARAHAYIEIYNIILQNRNSFYCTSSIIDAALWQWPDWLGDLFGAQKWPMCSGYTFGGTRSQRARIKHIKRTITARIYACNVRTYVWSMCVLTYETI